MVEKKYLKNYISQWKAPGIWKTTLMQTIYKEIS